MNDLALLYDYQSNFQEANSYYKKSLAIIENAYGPNHQIVATVLKNMAGLYRDAFKEDKAQRLEDRALEIIQHLRSI